MSATGRLVWPVRLTFRGIAIRLSDRAAGADDVRRGSLRRGGRRAAPILRNPRSTAVALSLAMDHSNRVAILQGPNMPGPVV